MPHFFEKQDRWGNRMSLWALAGMVFLIPLSAWSVLSLRMENEVQRWIPRDNPDSRVLEWSRRYFPAEDAILFTWEGSRLDDPRVARLVRKVRGTVDKAGKRRGGSKLIARVRTPQELIAQMEKDGVPHDAAVASLKGLLVGAGPVRIRLTEFGRARRDKVVAALRQRALESLGIKIEIADPAVAALDLAELALTAKTNGGEAENSEAKTEAQDPAEPEPNSVAADGSENAGRSDVTEGIEPPTYDVPAHDLAVTWPGMHWDEAQQAAFKTLAVELRLALPRSHEPSPPVIEECFQVPGSPIALAISLSEAGNADRAGAFRWLSDAAEDCGIDPETIHLAGGAVAEAALDRESLNVAWDQGAPIYKLHRRSILLTSGLAAGALLCWFLKNVRLAGLVLGVSLFVALVSAAVIPATGGALNLLLVVLPTLVLVITLSGAIPFTNYWQRAAEGDLKTAVSRTLDAARGPCLWAGLAVAIGQFSLLASSLAPVRDFGLYSGLGTLIALGVTLYGLPAVFSLSVVQPSGPEQLDRTVWHWLAAWSVRRQKVVVTIGILGPAACLIGIGSFKTEMRVIRAFADNTRIVKDYEYVEDHLGGIAPVELIVRFDRESQQQLKFLQRRDLIQKIQSDLDQLPEISGTFSLVNFLPPVSAPSERASVREKAKYNTASSHVEDQVKEGGLPAAKALLAVAEQASEFNAEGDELWRVTANAGIMSHENLQEVCAKIDEIASTVLRGTSGEAIEKVPPMGKKRSYHPGASHVVTGEVPLFLVAQRDLRKSLILSCAIAFGAITVVMMIALKHPLAGLLVIVPKLLPIGALIGIVSWCGVPFNIGTVVTASLALGLAVGGALHLVPAFRLAVEHRNGRAEALGIALGQCGPGIWQTTLVSSISLLAFSSSVLLPAGQFGWLLALLVAAAGLADLILLPALLAGPLGAVLERSVAGAHGREAGQEKPLVQPAPAVLAAPGAIAGKPHIGKKGVRIRRID